MAGAFGYAKYDLSMKIGEDRLFPAIRKRDSKTVPVACGFSCRHQVHDACGVMPKHWVEILRPIASDGKSSPLGHTGKNIT